MRPLSAKKPEKINPRALQQSYLDKITTELEDKGVVFFEVNKNLHISENYLELPANITDVPSRELGEYLNAFTQQKVYLRTLLSQIGLLVEEARRVYYEKSGNFYEAYSKTKMSETAKERLINEEPEVKPLYYAYIDYRQKESLIESSISNIEDITFMISREVTRRTGDFNEENRLYNVQNR